MKPKLTISLLASLSLLAPLSAQESYPDLPALDSIPGHVAEVGKARKVTNLLLMFLDFYISNEAYAELKAGGFQLSNLPATIADLKHYGYDVAIPETADEYREKVYPALMDLHAKAGYHGVQIPVGGVPFDEKGVLTDDGKALVKQHRAVVEGAGLKPSAVGGMWVPDWTQCIKPQIQAANLLGSKYIYGPFATPFMMFPEDTAAGGASAEWARVQAKQFGELVNNEIAPFAAKHDVVLCDEPLQRFERMPIHLKEATQMVLDADSDQLRVMVDMCHEMADGGGPAVYNGLIDQLFAADKFMGVHVSAVHRGKVHESWFNQQYFAEFFGPLFENGYEGEISIETFDAIEPVVTVVKINRDPFKHPVGVMINQLVFTTTMLKDL